MLAGEITTKAVIDYPKIVRQTVEEIGYADATWGFDAHTCAVMCAVEQQSPDIAMGVDEGEKGVIINTYYCGRSVTASGGSALGGTQDCGMIHPTFKLDLLEASSRANSTRIASVYR